MGTQVPVAARVKQEVGLPTITLGLITQPVRAETILNRGEADAIAPARGMLYDPRSPWHASAELGGKSMRHHRSGACSLERTKCFSRTQRSASARGRSLARRQADGAFSTEREDHGTSFASRVKSATECVAKSIFACI